MKINRKTILRIILIPFLLHWIWWLYHYASAMHYMIGLGWGNINSAPTIYLVVQSWVLLSEIMVMVILILLTLTLKRVQN